jgi:hypothetical protein
MAGGPSRMVISQVYSRSVRNEGSDMNLSVAPEPWVRIARIVYRHMLLVK